MSVFPITQTRRSRKLNWRRRSRYWWTRPSAGSSSTPPVLPCDIARSAITTAGLNYKFVSAPAGTTAKVQIGQTYARIVQRTGCGCRRQGQEFRERHRERLEECRLFVGPADPDKVNKPMIVLLIVVLALCGAMAYGPIAAMFVELFPSRIRYTAMSLPHHVGTGWFGGFLPATAFAISASTGDIYAGLWYPVVLSGACFIIGLLLLRETKDVNINPFEKP